MAQDGGVAESKAEAAGITIGMSGAEAVEKMLQAGQA